MGNMSILLNKIQKGAKRAGMKYFSVFIIILLLCGCATTQRLRTYAPLEMISQIPGLNKNQIYDQSKVFIAENFRSAKAVIDLDNKEQGTLIGNGNIGYPCGNSFTCGALRNWRVHFKMRIDVKDEKVRISFSDLRTVYPPSPGQRYPVYVPPSEGGDYPLYDDEYEQVKPALIEIANNLVASLTHAKKKDDW